MNNYHRQNLVEYYRQLVALCMIIIVLASLLTAYVVYRSFERVRQTGGNTFVRSSTGASVHIYSKQNEQWKTY
jgi:hypothetical protein